MSFATSPDLPTAVGASDEPLQACVDRRAHQVRALRVHTGVCVGSLAVILLVNLAINLAAGTAGDWRAWWSALAVLGWGTGVLIHGLVVWVSGP